MSKPVVSVVMAVFNVGNFSILDLAIMSIIKQDMPDWELLICDDGSTDGTYAQVLEWERKDSRIHVLRNEFNQKAAAARNRCIDMAKGEYIAIMDADDICDSNRFRVQVEFLERHSEYNFVGLYGERFLVHPGDTKNPYWFCSAPNPKDFLMTLPFVHASLMFHASAIFAVGGYKETASVTRSEDYDMLLRMYAIGLRGANINTSIYYIREDEHTYRRRKYRYRFYECLVKWRGFKKMGLMPKALPYALKPLVVGLIPIQLLKKLKKQYYSQTG